MLSTHRGRVPGSAARPRHLPLSSWFRGEASGPPWRPIGLNTEFIAGVLVGAHDRRHALRTRAHYRRAPRDVGPQIGGFDAVKDYLAEDFVLGKLAAERGYGVILSSYVIEHRIGAQRFGANVGIACDGAAARAARGRGDMPARSSPILCLWP